MAVCHQAIIWTNVGLLLIGPWEKNDWNVNQNMKIFHGENALEIYFCKMAHTLSWPDCDSRQKDFWFQRDFWSCPIQSPKSTLDLFFPKSLPGPMTRIWTQDSPLVQPLGRTDSLEIKKKTCMIDVSHVNIQPCFSIIMSSNIRIVPLISHQLPCDPWTGKPQCTEVLPTWHTALPNVNLLNIFCPFISHTLTHWGRVTHICVSKLTITISDNGLSPGRRQAII